MTAKINSLLDRQGKKHRKITEIKAREKDWHTERKKANQFFFLTHNIKKNIK